MEIDSVEIIYQDPENKTSENFLIHWKGTEETTALLTSSTDNRHYHEVAEWYKAQKKKPFKFDF